MKFRKKIIFSCVALGLSPLASNPAPIKTVKKATKKTTQLSNPLDIIAQPLSNAGKLCSEAIEPLKTAAHSHELGFQTLAVEGSQIALPVTGSIPTWLNGSFITVGPGIFELNDSKASHWLDGFAMIHLFAIEKGNVNYTNKLIDSFYYQDCCSKGKLRGSTPEQKKSTWSKLTSAVSSNPRPVYDNTNMNIAMYNNKLVALTETPHALQIDPKTMDTQGKFNYNDKIEAHFSSAHTIFDPITQEWYGVAIQYAHNSDYIVYKMKANSSQRTVVARLNVGYPAYMHSFALTPNYIILTESPFTVSPYDLLLSDHSFIENFNWTPKNGTHFIVIDRKTGKKVTTLKTDAFFTLHHVNAIEKDGQIIIDLIAYKDPDVIKAFNMKNLTSARTKVPAGHLKRYTLDIKANKVNAHLLSPHHTVELPQINPAKLMHDYRYVYATASNENGVAQQLIKFDLNSKRHLIWSCKGCYPTEPIFVVRPGAIEEDDGVVLSVVLDAATQQSFLLILDGKSFKELSRAYTPHHVPFTVHSKFFAKK